MTNAEWYAAHGCDHAHCPCGCDHPQPFTLPDDSMVCGQCAICDGVLCRMVPCVPATCGEATTTATMEAAMEGVVKSIKKDKGFGFIRAQDGTEYFFHRSGAQDFDLLQEGNRVTFAEEVSGKGPRGTGVKRL